MLGRARADEHEEVSEECSEQSLEQLIVPGHGRSPGSGAAVQPAHHPHIPIKTGNEGTISHRSSSRASRLADYSRIVVEPFGRRAL
jgi:hypothetical protein